MPHFMIVLIPCINFLNLSWTIKCLFLRDMVPLTLEVSMKAVLMKEIKSCKFVCKNISEDTQEMPQS